jgi:hypothetical protein
MKTRTEVLQARFGAQIDELRKQHGGVTGYVSEDDKCALFRHATIDDLAAVRHSSAGNALLFDKLLIETCWLAGDEELRTVDKYLLGIMSWSENLIQKVSGEMVEL